MNITRKLTNAKLERKRTHNLRKNTQTVNGLLADFLFLMLDSYSVSYCNICRKCSDFADQKSLMFIGKIVDRMDTCLPIPKETQLKLFDG